MSDIRKLIGQAIIFTEIRVMLQAQSVFILGIYEGEYSPGNTPPPKKIKFFWYFGPEFSIVTKSQWLIQGDASLPAPTVHRNWPF